MAIQSSVTVPIRARWHSAGEAAGNLVLARTALGMQRMRYEGMQ